MKKYYILFFAALSILLFSCVSTPDKPWQVEPKGSSHYTEYLIGKWWLLESRKINNNFIERWRERYHNSGNQIFWEWYKKSLPNDQFSFFEADMRENKLSFRGDIVNENHLMLLNKAEAMLLQPINIAVRRNEFQYYAWYGNNHELNSDFHSWLAENIPIALSESDFPTGTPRARPRIAMEVREHITKMVEKLKENISNLANESPKRAFDECRRILPELSEKKYHEYFLNEMVKYGKFYFEDMMQKLENKLKDISPDEIANELEMLYQLESEFKVDDQTREISETCQKLLLDLEVSCGNAIGKKWGDELSFFHSKKQFWSAYLFVCRQEKLMAGRLRPSVVQISRPMLYDKFNIILKDTLQHFITFSQDEITKSNRYGTGLSFCLMANEIIDFMEKNNIQTTEEVSKGFNKVINLRKLCEEWIQNYNVYRRGIKINEFRPGGGERGTEFSMEMEILIADLLRNQTVGSDFAFLRKLLSNVHFITTRESCSATDYELVDGLLSEPDSSFISTQESRYDVTLPGEVEEYPNPVFTEQSVRGKSTVGIPEYYYKQSYYTYFVTRVVTEAMADVNVIFDILRNSESKRVSVQLAQKLKKEFTNETYNSFETKIIVKDVTATDKGTSEVPYPELIKEKIWNKLELLARARKEAMRLAVIEVINEVAQLPLEFAADAVKAENTTDPEGDLDLGLVLHFWGLAYASLLPVEVDFAPVDDFFTTEDGITEHAASQKQKILDTMRKLHALKNDVYPKIVQCGYRFLEPGGASASK